MYSFLPKQDLQNNNKPIFNINDYESQFRYVTFADLLEYANLYTSNIFQTVNFFNAGLNFSGYINNVSDTVFDYLKNVSSDIQEQFNSLFLILSNYNYDIESNTQSISSSLGCPNIISNKIEANEITNNILLSNKIVSNTINTKTFTCENIYSKNIPMVYIYNQNTLYPIISSGLLSKLTGFDNTKNTFITIAPNCQIIFYDSRKVPISMISNITNDYIYYTSVNVANCISFIINKI